MKRLFTLFAVSGLMTAAFAQNAPAPAKVEPKISWNETTHTFGDVKMGPAAEATFTFTNNTGGPIQVLSANASCGCTTPSYTNTEVADGATGIVKASFGTEGRPGGFTKTVTVTFSNGATQILTITGNVITPPAAEPKPASNGGGSQ